MLYLLNLYCIVASDDFVSAISKDYVTFTQSNGHICIPREKQDDIFEQII